MAFEVLGHPAGCAPSKRIVITALVWSELDRVDLNRGKRISKRLNTSREFWRVKRFNFRDSLMSPTGMNGFQKWHLPFKALTTTLSDEKRWFRQMYQTYFVDFCFLKLTVFACFKLFRQKWLHSFHFLTRHGSQNTHVAIVGYLPVTIFLGVAPVVPLKELGRAGPCGWQQQKRTALRKNTEYAECASCLESLGAGCPIFRSDRAMVCGNTCVVGQSW